MQNEKNKRIRIKDLEEGNRVRFPDGPDGGDVVYTIRRIHKPGHGDCYVELAFTDAYGDVVERTAMHESEEAVVVMSPAEAVQSLETMLESPPKEPLVLGGYVFYRAMPGPGVFVCFDNTDEALALCRELLRAQLPFDWDGHIMRFRVRGRDEVAS
jgi:hypothetical protein